MLISKGADINHVNGVSNNFVREVVFHMVKCCFIIYITIERIQSITGGLY